MPYAWWDFSDLSTLFQDNGVTPVTSNGQYIYLATDKAGNGHNLRQTVATRRPRYFINLQNGLGGSFHGASSGGRGRWLERPELVLNQPVTILLVGRISNLVTNNVFSDSVTTNGMTLYNSHTQGKQLFGAIGSILEDTATNIHQAIANGVNSKYRINYGVVDSGDIGSGILNGFRLGDIRDAFASYYLDGHVFECKIFNSELTIDQLTIEADIMNAKWAVV